MIKRAVATILCMIDVYKRQAVHKAAVKVHVGGQRNVGVLYFLEQSGRNLLNGFVQLKFLLPALAGSQGAGFFFQ